MTDQPFAAEVVDKPLADALGERYLAYALSTITARSLPDVRDGLKPVHRRLLFAMRQLRLDPDQGFKKSARVVGDVIGKFHPHGDTAVYDALVRLAQDFAVRYPLIDGQGNFGSVDGDNAAAMRYTEARLTEVAQALLDGIDENAVDFRPTYDDEGEEPTVLPANFPNLLANGAAGIAVGMATSIPPHNVGEICKALLHLIKFPRATFDKLVEFIPGPDLPTGGVLVEPPEAIVEAYATGRGSFRLRARWQKEKIKGGGYQIIVTEMPYQVQKARLIEKMADLMHERKLPQLADIRDESAEDVRFVLVPKNRTLDAEAVMEGLFRRTELETRLSLNMNVLDATGTPRVMNLREVLQSFLDHRHTVLVRRTEHRLDKIAHRLEILRGYIIAYLNLDEVIRIIREEDEPKKLMMKKWKLSDVQAEAILNMRLRALRKLEEIEIREELATLEAEEKDLKLLLKDDKRRWTVISDQIRETGKRFGGDDALGRRRTTMGDAPSAEIIPIETVMDVEPVTVLCSAKGWIRARTGHLEPDAEVKYKDGDTEKFRFHAQTSDRLIAFASNGRFYTLPADKLPGGRGHGEPLRLMVNIGNAEEIVALMVHRPGRKLIVASSDGRGLVVPEDEVVAQTRNGKQILNLAGDAEAQACTVVEGTHVAVIGENRKLLIFPLDQVPEMTRGRGNRLQRYKDGGLSDVKVFTLAEGLAWHAGSRTRTLTKAELKNWLGSRAQAGRLPPQGSPRNNRFDG
ncbi:MAG TPA: DNA topoisomerase IV subunit A [Alphaproteobacteria bacterium]|nr:DNA topoisomerase IV subunit A [Alphaproteobacteria bacterium]